MKQSIKLVQVVELVEKIEEMKADIVKLQKHQAIYERTNNANPERALMGAMQRNEATIHNIRVLRNAKLKDAIDQLNVVIEELHNERI